MVGPAGTGKTTALAVAVADLHSHGRPVFGVAPTAKAAEVLGRETGMATDTVAKLLHEWSRAGRSPLPGYRLAPGATLIVDEAGLVGTASLARLVELAEARRWRLVLVGDPAPTVWSSSATTAPGGSGSRSTFRSTTMGSSGASAPGAGSISGTRTRTTKHSPTTSSSGACTAVTTMITASS